MEVILVSQKKGLRSWRFFFFLNSDLKLCFPLAPNIWPGFFDNLMIYSVKLIFDVVQISPKHVCQLVMLHFLISSDIVAFERGCLGDQNHFFQKYIVNSVQHCSISCIFCCDYLQKGNVFFLRQDVKRKEQKDLF